MLLILCFCFTHPQHILEKVVQYLKQRGGVAPDVISWPLISSVMADVTDKWSADYIDKIGEVRQDLYDLTLAANYMDIAPLLRLCCSKIGTLVG